MYFQSLLPIFVLLIYGGIIAGIIYFVRSIIRYFNNTRQLKIEQNQLLSQIHQELEKLNNRQKST